LTITFSNENKVSYTAYDASEQNNEFTYTPPGEIFPTDQPFKAIGIISETGSGECVYTFDDVYVLRDEECPNINVVATYTHTIDKAHGLAFDGTNLWAVQYAPGVIYKLQLNPDDGTAYHIQTIDIMTGDNNNCTGLTFEGKNLWAPCSYEGDPRATIYNIDQDGKIKKSFPAPGEDSTGMTFDGKYLWNGDFTSGIRKIETNGKLVDTYPSPGPEPEGLAFDGEHLWHSDVSTNRIYKLDTSGNVICSYKGPGSYPIGLTFDGTYLWLIDWDFNLYKIDIGFNN